MLQTNFIEKYDDKILFRGRILVIHENSVEGDYVKLTMSKDIKVKQTMCNQFETDKHIYLFIPYYAFPDQVRGLRPDGIVLYHVRVRLMHILEMLSMLKEKHNLIELGWEQDGN